MPDGRKLRPDSKWKLHPDSRISSLKKCSVRWRWRWRWRLEMIGGALPKPPGLRMEKNSFCPHNVLRVIPGYGIAVVVQSLSCFWLFVTPLDYSMPGSSVLQDLPEHAQIHVHWVADAIQPSHPLPTPSPFAFKLSQHQGLFQWLSSLHQVAKVLELQLQQPSFQWIFRTDFF